MKLGWSGSKEVKAQQKNQASQDTPKMLETVKSTTYGYYLNYCSKPIIEFIIFLSESQTPSLMQFGRDKKHVMSMHNHIANYKYQS